MTAPVLGMLSGPLRLFPRRTCIFLLGRLLLSTGVRGLDELLAAAPAEGPHEQNDPEDDVPRRRHELLADRVRSRGRGVRYAFQRSNVERLVDTGTAGCGRRNTR